MANYRFSVTATKGIDPAAVRGEVYAYLSNGTYISSGNSDVSDGVFVSNMMESDDSYNLTGGELVWCILDFTDADWNYIQTSTIGPYIISEIGTLVE